MSETSPSEPLLNAPPVTLLLPAALLAVYGYGVFAGTTASEALVNAFALNTVYFRHGDVLPLVTHIFLHGSLMHVMMNAVVCLAFSAPVARATGTGLAGSLSFLGFFILCGVLAALTFIVLSLDDYAVLVGASGSISGVLAASMRIRPEGGLRGLFDQRVVSMTLAFVGLNLLSSVAEIIPGAEGVAIAWQAHIGGYVAGLLLIGVWLRVFRPSALVPPPPLTTI
jgi:membrane associated rhomboid family serine protease